MNRHATRFSIGLLIVLMPGKACLADRPNIIVVMTDDQGYGDLSCHGNADVQTPHLDQLYHQSVRFTNFHVDPTCAPTRAALITGRYSLSTGVWHTIAGRSFLHPEEVTIADVLQNAGYATGMFGKWHLGDNYPCRPHDRGFDQAVYHGGGGIGQTPDLWGNDYFDDRYFHNGKPRQFKGYCTDVWFDEAVRFMSTRRDDPFFCYLLPNAPHGPYLVDKKYSKPFVERGFSQDRANFYGMLVNIDENMGRLDAFLKDEGLRDNTIVIFMTDNGTAGPWYPKEGADHTAGLRGIKGSIYEGGHRVPLFVRWPGGRIGRGRDIAHLAAHIDVLPTLMELSGATRPSGPALHGRSLAPLLRDPDAEWEHRSLVVNNQRIAVPMKYKDFVVMSEPWRLVGKDELYNLYDDRGQQNNVAARHPEVIRELLKSYNEWWNNTSGRTATLVPITVGSDHENPTSLTAHDWHTDRIPWHQEVVAAAPAFNGHWEITVAESGHYRVTLMERPLEANHSIAAASAVLEVGGQRFRQAIPSGAKQILFDVELKLGRTRLKSSLTNDSGVSRGAYYVSVLRRSASEAGKE
ncbi:MAG: arylsulfatase [Fuerstiella sp.]|nr:arylsulfatase [Fuerstiella sp.]